MLLPAVLFTVALFIYPFLYGIGLTIQPTQGMQEKWGGGIWANYIAFFSDPFVFDSVWITLRLALPAALFNVLAADRKSTRLNSSHVSISYAVFCLKKKKKNISTM